MTEDKRARLDEIKELDHRIAPEDYLWLITELEAAWAEIAKLLKERPVVVLTWGGSEKTGLIDANRIRAEAAEQRARDRADLLSLLREARDCLLSETTDQWANGWATNLIARIDAALKESSKQMEEKP